MSTLREAAAARAAAVRAPADRPQRRRCDEDDASLAVVRASVAGIELTERATGDGERLSFLGHASVTETPYEMYDMWGPYTEVVSATAFDATLAQDGLDVPLVLDHATLRRIARTTNGTLTLAVDERGLRVEADLDPTDVDVAYIAPKLRSGLIDEMSFKFRITSGMWSPDYTEYRIESVDIHRGDVAIVGYGANPHTAGAGLRSDDSDGRPIALMRMRLLLAESERRTA